MSAPERTPWRGVLLISAALAGLALIAAGIGPALGWWWS